MKLFHGSYDENIVIDKNASYSHFSDALFFVESKNIASNYGHFIYVTDVDDSAILTQQDLWYNLDHNIVIKALKDVAESECISSDDEALERLYQLVIDDENVDTTIEDANLLGCDEALNEICWNSQRLRILVAEKLGYKVVEMNDENGISYAVINPVLKLDDSK